MDSFRDGDKIGVVSFNDVADNPAPLTLRDWNLANRDLAIAAINGLTPVGGTCIGCGLQKGLDELIALGAATHSWALIVLSDGQENVGAIATFITAYNARRTAGNQVPVVHTVALGPDADHARLEKLAADTGGTFSFASLPSASAAAEGVGTSAIQATSLSNNLAEIYRVIGEEVAGQQQVYAETDSGLKLDVPYTKTIPIDGAVSEAIFVVKIDGAFTGFNTVLYKPDGTPIQGPTLQDNQHRVWRIPTPDPGEWKMELLRYTIINAAGANDPNAIDVGENDEVLVEAAVVSNLTLDVYLGLPVDERLVGKPMPIFATLADSAPITGAGVTAYVYGPTGGLFPAVTLYDDGLHDDGAANDGFYGNVFYQTQTWGSYDVVVFATGTGDEGPFVRRQRLGFSMLETRNLDDPNINPNVDPSVAPDDPGRDDSDTDDDGMPDWWEEENGLDPNSNDAAGDKDHDGLTNGEEYGLGTDPENSDSDGGGQNDGSEHTSGTDPLDPSDDQVPCPLFFQAETVYHDRDEHLDAKAVILYYDVAADYATVSIWRAGSAEGPLQPLALDTPATGVYTDTTAALNTPYFYWLSANDAGGHASCILGPEAIKRTSDPLHPEGVVMINNGAKATAFVDVVIDLNASADTTEMQIRNRPDEFSEDEGWEEYKPTKPWTLDPEGDQGNVYVLFRDAAGNHSEPEFDSIEIKEGTRLFMPQLRNK